MAAVKNDCKPLDDKRKYIDSKKIPTTDDLTKIEVLTSIGLSLKAVATDLGVSHDVVQRWKTKYPQIEKAFSVGRLKRQKRAYTCFFSQAFPIDDLGRPTCKGDPSLMIYWMKTREKWKESAKNITVTGSYMSAPSVEYALKNVAEAETNAEIMLEDAPKRRGRPRKTT